MTTSPNIFDQWAEVYDVEPNPLIALEGRTLPPLLPLIAEAHVWDVGCGTGRWLQYFELLDPASLTGSDPSEGMLSIARKKLSAHTRLFNSNADQLDAPNSSLDLIVASFVVSYIQDLPSFAKECARVLRSGAYLILTDMHPVTAAERSWSRGFKQGRQQISVPAYTRTIHGIVQACAQQGLSLVEQLEPGFAEQERPIFVQAEKQAIYEELQEIPAIYLLKFQKRISLEIINTRSSIGATTWSAASIHLANGRIASMPDHESEVLDLSGYTVLPGLVNAHDHLEFGLFPNLGRTKAQPPYRNSAEWANEIHQTHADTIARHRQVPLETRLWFGIIRNLLVGVTTVCHHNPMYPELARYDLPIHVVSDISWAHSLSFDKNLASRFTDSPACQPFILHAGEGVDEASRNELHQLDARYLLTPRTVLVHGLAFDKEDIDLLNRRCSGLIFCPTSNRFLFGQAISNDLIEHTRRGAVASDSPITASGDLLDEIACLRDRNLDPGSIFDLVTTKPAELLQLRDGQGSLEIDTSADLIVVSSSYATPSDVLAHLDLGQIELVVVHGQIQLASGALYQRLPSSLRAHLHCMTIDGLERWINAPVPTLFATAEHVLGHGKLRLGNKEVRYPSSL